MADTFIPHGKPMQNRKIWNSEKVPFRSVTDPEGKSQVLMWIKKNPSYGTKCAKLQMNVVTQLDGPSNNGHNNNSTHPSKIFTPKITEAHKDQSRVGC